MSVKTENAAEEASNSTSVKEEASVAGEEGEEPKRRRESQIDERVDQLLNEEMVVAEGDEIGKSKPPKKKSRSKKPKRKKSRNLSEGGGCYDPRSVEESASEVTQRFKQGCECQDENCFNGLNPENVYRHRLNIAELTKAEHDMYLMGVTMACLTDPQQTARHKERRRLRAQYVYQGRRVCLDAFCYLENCTRYQIKRIRKHLVMHGVSPRVHGNHGKIPHNTFSLDIYQSATDFLKNFVQQQEFRQKTKAGKYTPLHLPAEINRKIVHDMYTEYCENSSPSIKVMGYSTFRRFMKVQFPQVKFAKLEFVVRNQQQQQQQQLQQQQQQQNIQISGKPEAEESAEIADDTKSSELVAAENTSGELLPVVIASEQEQNENGPFFLTPVKKFSEGYRLTDSGILVHRTGEPVTLSRIDSV